METTKVRRNPWLPMGLFGSNCFSRFLPGIGGCANVVSLVADMHLRRNLRIDKVVLDFSSGITTIRMLREIVSWHYSTEHETGRSLFVKKIIEAVLNFKLRT